jgi:hypothetical protein
MPPILLSLYLGYRDPEKKWYGIGFGATGLSFIVLGFILHLHLIASMKNKPRKIAILNMYLLFFSPSLSLSLVFVSSYALLLVLVWPHKAFSLYRVTLMRL